MSMNDRIVTSYKLRKENGAFRTVYRARGPSELSDVYLIQALRGMENNMPDEIEVGYFEDCDEIEDEKDFRNYEVFKIEAETRGLTWRQGG